VHGPAEVGRKAPLQGPDQSDERRILIGRSIFHRDSGADRQSMRSCDLCKLDDPIIPYRACVPITRLGCTIHFSFRIITCGNEASEIGRDRREQQMPSGRMKVFAFRYRMFQMVVDKLVGIELRSLTRERVALVHLIEQFPRQRSQAIYSAPGRQ
jgi:hypothetical protein